MAQLRGLLVFVIVIVACSGDTGSTTSTTGATPSTFEFASTTSVAPTSTITTTSAQSAGTPFQILVFHRTEGFRHESIDAGIAAIEALGEEHGFVVDDTEDSAVFSDQGLADYGLVVFLSTTGDVLDDDEQVAMEQFVSAGGGFVGIHAAADTEYEWAWYGELVAAYFRSHPEPQEAELGVVAPDHPLVTGIPESFRRTDEWYDFQTVPGDGVTILIVVDETSYQGGAMGDQHPISWAHESLGGRAFYTAMGHTVESFSDPIFATHLRNGILWAARR